MIEKSPLQEAHALALRGDLDAAILKFSEYLNGDFFNDEALFMLGTCLQAKGMNGLGAVIQSAAIDARKARGREYPEAMFNLGACYRAESQNEIALRIWEDTLKVETLPVERSRLYTNMSALFLYACTPEKALPYCRKALEEDQHNLGVKVNLGTAYLEMGEWEPGWELWSRATLATKDRPPIVYKKRGQSPIPEWDGTPGQTVIVWGDQGIGDEIYFANCLADMMKVSKKVILDCHPRLENLFRRSFPLVEVHGTRKDLTARTWVEDCDAEAAVGLTDLSRYFRKHGEWDGKPYILADSEIHPAAKPRKIGISWAGGSKRTKTAFRSVPLLALEPIIRALPDADWYSLQYTENGPLENAAREVCEFEEKTGLRLRHYPGWVECRDYDQTASFVASLDLVITVCTTVHHLAGALGIPVWTLVPSRPSWRYQTRGETLPWYGSAKLYRQETGGDWSGPIERIARDLADL